MEEAWDLLWKDVLVYLLATLVCLLLAVVSVGVLSGVAAVGFAILVARRRTGEDVGPGAVFAGFNHFFSATLALAVMVVGVTLGLALLVLPGLFLLAAWSLTFCAIASEGLNAGEALSRSYGVFKEHALLLIVLLIVLGVLNTIAATLVFLELLSVPYSLIALSVAYEKLAQASLSRPKSSPDDGMRPHRV